MTMEEIIWHLLKWTGVPGFDGERRPQIIPADGHQKYLTRRLQKRADKTRRHAGTGLIMALFQMWEGRGVRGLRARTSIDALVETIWVQGQASSERDACALQKLLWLFQNRWD